MSVSFTLVAACLLPDSENQLTPRSTGSSAVGEMGEGSHLNHCLIYASSSLDFVYGGVPHLRKLKVAYVCR